ncbi:enoyl-CoA hydratase, R-specific, partial [Pseudomonas sp. FG-3G]
DPGYQHPLRSPRSRSDRQLQQDRRRARHPAVRRHVGRSQPGAPGCRIRCGEHVQGAHRPWHVQRCADQRGGGLRAAWAGHHLYRPADEFPEAGEDWRHPDRAPGDPGETAEVSRTHCHSRVQSARRAGGGRRSGNPRATQATDRDLADAAGDHRRL